MFGYFTRTIGVDFGNGWGSVPNVDLGHGCLRFVASNFLPTPVMAFCHSSFPTHELCATCGFVVPIKTS